MKAYKRSPKKMLLPGYFTYSSIIILLGTSLFLGLLGSIMAQELDLLAQLRDQKADVRAFQERAGELFTQITGEWDPDTMSLQEFLVDQLAEGEEHIDHSSRINLNFIDPSWFNNTEFQEDFLQGNAVDLQAFRVDRGFGTDLSHYGEFFSPELMAEYYTVFGVLNFNHMDEFALEMLVTERTGEVNAGTRFRNLLREARLSGRVYAEEELQSEFLSSAQLEGLLTTRPWWNVNTLPERTLRALISYPFYEIEEPESKFAKEF
jgi:hypothetical protein